MNVVPELAPLWAPNQLSNWSFLPHFCCFPHLLETLIFIVVLYKLQFKTLKFEAQLWSNFQILENQFELLSGRFVDPELPFKISPRIQAKKKRRHHEKTTTTRNPNVSFCRKERFREKKRKKTTSFFALGLLAFLCIRPLNTIAQKNIKQGFCFFVFMLCFLRSQTNKQTNKQTNNNNNNQNRNNNQAEQKRNAKTDDNTKPTNKINSQKKFCCFLVLFFFGSCCCPNNQNKTTKPQCNKPTTKKQKQQPAIKNKQQQEEQPILSFLSSPFFSNDCTLKIDGLTS